MMPRQEETLRLAHQSGSTGAALQRGMSQPRIPAALRIAVRERAHGRCEYCRMPETGFFFSHELDHSIATQHRGRTELENLALACFQCNRLKGPNIASVDPETK